MRLHRVALAFVGAAFISNIGTHMQSFSEQWLVLLQAGPEAARWAGRMSFATGLGVAVATPLGGWLADHARRGRSLAWTQVGLAAVALLMAFLAWKGRLGLSSLVLCALAGGTFAGLMLPLQLSLVGDLSAGDTALFGYMQVQWNLSRILGPLVAALLFTLFGAAGNFLLNALSFLPLILLVSGRPESRPEPRTTSGGRSWGRPRSSASSAGACSSWPRSTGPATWASASAAWPASSPPSASGP